MAPGVFCTKENPCTPCQMQEQKPRWLCCCGDCGEEMERVSQGIYICRSCKDALLGITTETYIPGQELSPAEVKLLRAVAMSPVGKELGLTADEPEEEKQTALVLTDEGLKAL